ncbi:glycosyltransferase family 4 protein [Paenibacillus methanolicus]|uniref:Glycosyltransferase involved in cell wall biosynthesis n=1 Tax=Paenibacillus methanolicus TaxID=582686 RepID=A0A5S5CCH0_9BACL|nr:glycosyltransferase family 4 protein [Paenibacillus methanolicus]TYP76348.1 glycosyltransferase involved in cell wall biosynthesis [Paenibacillus methanolicus]
MSKVGILTHSFADAYNGRLDRIFGGGLERYIFNLCGVIREMGAEPEVHQLSFQGDFDRAVEGIRVKGYACTHSVRETFGRMSREAEGRLIYSSQMWTMLDYRPGSLGICHGINWDEPRIDGAPKEAVRQAIQHALSELTMIVTVDSHFLTYCRSACRYDDREKVRLIPNAVDTDIFAPAGERANYGELRVLFPRRISVERGIVPMMLAADRLLDAYPQAVIEFAGETIGGDPLCEAFRIWLDRHPEQDRLLHRVYPFGQVAEAYRRADIAVIPSVFSEGTSYACLEALSCGIPVVASQVGGLNDLILNGYNGLLVHPGEQELADAIGRLIEDADLRLRMGARARETALAFGEDEWRAKWRAVLTTFLAHTHAAV